MTQGQLEHLPLAIQKQWTLLEQRIMRDIVRRIKINGFGTASASWQVTRLQQLGESDEQVKKWLQEALKASKDEVEKIFSDEAYKQYMGEGRGYEVFGKKQLAFHDNNLLHSTIDAMTAQVQNEFENLANSASFAIRDMNGRIHYTPVAEFYRETVDGAIMDIESGALTYQKVLERTVSSISNSGLRGWVDYDSGWRNRVDVAVRRSVLTGWRQIQGQISEQTAADLGTDSYEVTVHIGARPSHQEWEGKVWTKQQLIDVCGLGTVTGLHGANCYHDYYPFIPGISERTYTDKQLDQIHADENATKTYKGKEYTTYDALQKQRELETRCRALSEKIDLLEHGDSDPDVVVLHKAKYKATLAEYKAFSDKMDLPMQRQRITQNGLKVDLRGIDSKSESGITNKRIQRDEDFLVNFDVVNSNEYKRKFSGISGNTLVDNAIHKYAKAGLTHRNGTKMEDLYILSSEDGTVLGKNVSSTKEYEVPTNKSVIDAVISNTGKTIGLHTHPTDTPPTGSDFEVSYGRKYDFGVVVCTDGNVYKYKHSSNYLSGDYIDATIEKFKKMIDSNGRKVYSSYTEAHIAALQHLKEEYGLYYEKR